MPKIFVESRQPLGDYSYPLNSLGNYYNNIDEPLPYNQPTLFESQHLFLVFQDDDGSEKVIRGGPENPIPIDGFGNIKVTADTNFFDSKDSPVDNWGDTINYPRTELNLNGQDPATVWNVMTDQANAIGGSNVPYILDTQNSNSVITSSMGAAGFDATSSLPVGTNIGDFPGVDNTLPAIASRDLDDFYTLPLGF